MRCKLHHTSTGTGTGSEPDESLDLTD